MTISKKNFAVIHILLLCTTILFAHPDRDKLRTYFDSRKPDFKRAHISNSTFKYLEYLFNQRIKKLNKVYRLYSPKESVSFDFNDDQEPDRKYEEKLEQISLIRKIKNEMCLYFSIASDTTQDFSLLTEYLINCRLHHENSDGYWLVYPIELNKNLCENLDAIEKSFAKSFINPLNQIVCLRSGFSCSSLLRQKPLAVQYFNSHVYLYGKFEIFRGLDTGVTFRKFGIAQYFNKITELKTENVFLLQGAV